ncbi:hypothetical protein [Nostoc sp. UHCC 0251]|uniref:hypothetical protein n=1 Tax=Nostoc sp. UHCC 0251 TaxID=3110240 RepID=UPI002B1F042E|nr:hypothetical protein [Nostoc sp. UHCC 0251]
MQFNQICVIKIAFVFSISVQRSHSIWVHLTKSHCSLRQVPVAQYKTQRRRLAIAQAPRQQKRRLHRNPVSTIQSLVTQHQELLTVLEFQALKY